MPNLSTLILKNVILDYRFTNNPSLTNLTHLNLTLDDNDSPTDLFKAICQSEYLKNIEFLGISFATIYCLKYLVSSKINNLKHLILNDGSLTHAKDFFETKSKFEKLETLVFGRSDMDKDKEDWHFLATSKAFPNLTSFGSYEFAYEKGCIEKLCNNSLFYNLTCLDCSIAQDDIKHIKNLKKLKKVSLAEGKIDSNGYRELYSMPGLKFEEGMDTFNHF